MWQFFSNTFLYWLCPGSRARYWAVNPLPAMVPSERKVTHTVLLFVFTVGGATLPQNLQRMVEDSRTIPLPAYSSISDGALPPSTDRLVLCQRVVILQRQLIKHLSIWTCFPSVLSTRRLNMRWTDSWPTWWPQSWAPSAPALPASQRGREMVPPQPGSTHGSG